MVTEEGESDPRVKTELKSVMTNTRREVSLGNSNNSDSRALLSSTHFLIIYLLVTNNVTLEGSF